VPFNDKVFENRQWIGHDEWSALAEEEQASKIAELSADLQRVSDRQRNTAVLSDIRALTDMKDLTVSLTGEQRLTKIYDRLYHGAPNVGRIRLLHEKVLANSEMRAKLSLELQAKKTDEAKKRAKVQEFSFRSGGHWIDFEKYNSMLASHKEEQARLLQAAKEEEEKAFTELETKIADLDLEIDTATEELKVLKSSMTKTSSDDTKALVKEVEDRLKLKRKSRGTLRSSKTRMTKKLCDANRAAIPQPAEAPLALPPAAPPVGNNDLENDDDEDDNVVHDPMEIEENEGRPLFEGFNDPNVGRKCCVCYDATWFLAILVDFEPENSTYTAYYYSDKAIEVGVPLQRVSFDISKAS